MKQLSFSIACSLALLLPAASLPAHGKGGNCGFNSSGTRPLQFQLDPRETGPKTATAWVEVGDCESKAVPAMRITLEPGPRVMKNGAESIPYSLGPVTIEGGDAGPGNGVYKKARFEGTVQQSAYVDAAAGEYLDTLTLYVDP